MTICPATPETVLSYLLDKVDLVLSADLIVR
jgi:pentose-5-phosphate-3-epimerase